MNIRLKNIVEYKKEILNRVPDTDDKVLVHRLIDKLVLDVIEVGVMNIAEYAEVISSSLGEQTNDDINELLNYSETRDDRRKKEVRNHDA